MELFELSGIGLYLFIFVGKILEVTVSTVRIVLINRGERIKGTVIAVIEMLLWLSVTGTVLNGLSHDLWRIVIFAVAFATGNYVGSWLEDRLAFGLSSVQVIVPESETTNEVVHILREHNFAVTTIKGKGKDGEREVLLLHLKRKRISQAVELVKSNLSNAVVVVNDAKIVYGGFIRK